MPASSLLQYLPGIYQADPFLGQFLLAFEKVLLGLGDVDEPGLEEVLGGITDPVSGATRLRGIERYFEPGPELKDHERTPAEFLEWLSGWVALSLRADLDELVQRDFIARAAWLYRLRGTRQGLEETIRIYTRLAASIDETATPFQIGVHSTVGVDTLLDGGTPHFFRVLVRLATTDPAQIRKQSEVVRAILDMEKPTHTQYSLKVETPSLQIGVHSTVGVDTLLGAASG